MALDFPSSPSLNQVFTSGNRSWIWNGTEWIGNTPIINYTANSALLGNGTSLFQEVAPGTAGNLLTSNGTTWTSAAGPGVSGTTNYVAKFTSGTAIGNSQIFDNGTSVGVNQASPAAKLDLSGNYASNITAMGALDVDCSTANYFTKTINGNSTFTFSNPPSSRAFAFALELTHTSGAVTWPAAVKWPADTAPTLTAGKTHIFIFVTDDGGTRWRGASLVDYVN